MSNGPLKKCWACGIHYVGSPRVWIKVNGKTGPVRKIAAAIEGGRDVPIPLCPSCLRLAFLILHLTRDIQIDWEKELSERNGEDE